MSKTIKKTMKSPYRFYPVTVIWILWALLLPMYKPLHFIILIALSVAACYAAGFVLPRVENERPSVWKLTDFEDLAAGETLIKAIDASIMRTQDVKGITEARTSVMNDWSVTRKNARGIVASVKDDTEKYKIARRFFTYYLPTLQKNSKTISNLLTTDGFVENEAICKKALEEWEESFQTVKQVSDAVLQHVVEGQIEDISTENTVMTQISGINEPKLELH